MVSPAYPERTIRCTRLTLSRRDQQLGSWGQLYAFPIVHQHLGSSDTVVSTCEPYQRLLGPSVANTRPTPAGKNDSNRQRQDRPPHQETNTVSETSRTDHSRSEHERTGGARDPDCGPCSWAGSGSKHTRQDACLHNMSHLAITPSGNSDPVRVPPRLAGPRRLRPGGGCAGRGAQVCLLEKANYIVPAARRRGVGLGVCVRSLIFGLSPSGRGLARELTSSRTWHDRRRGASCTHKGTATQQKGGHGGTGTDRPWVM